MITTKLLQLVSILLCLILLSACGSLKSGSFKKGSGGYYQNDGPPRKTSELSKIQATPDAIPVVLPLSKRGNAPYRVFGKRYVPIERGIPYQKVGIASWYGKKYHGRKTSSGEIYDMYAMTAAHPTLPLPSFVRVKNLDNQKQVIVKVNDRGPFLENRLIDLSYVAAAKLGIVKTGTGHVEVTLLDPKMLTGDRSKPVTVRPIQVEPINASTNRRVEQKPIQVIEPASQTRQVEVKTEKVRLQVAAFANQQNAVSTQSKLLNEGFIEPTINRLERNQQTLFRVIVGPYPTTQLQTIQQKLEALGFGAIRINN